MNWLIHVIIAGTMSTLTQAQLRELACSFIKPPAHLPLEIVKVITEEVYKDDPKRCLQIIRSIPPRAGLGTWEGAALESYYYDVRIGYKNDNGIGLQRAVDSTMANATPWSKVFHLAIMYVPFDTSHTRRRDSLLALANMSVEQNTMSTWLFPRHLRKYHAGTF